MSVIIITFTIVSIFMFRLCIYLDMLYADEFNGRWHHFYTGNVFIVLVLFISLFWLKILFFIVGLWFMTDDIYQHRRQVSDRSYHSFLHYAGKPLYHFRKWLIKKTGWVWLKKI